MFRLIKKEGKTEQGIRRTKEAWFARVVRLFERPHIEQAFWDELEELLIAADVGVETTSNLLNRVRERASRDRLSSAPELLSALKEEMIGMLSLHREGESLTSASTLGVVLVVGVNGSGKTTSIAKLAHTLRQQGKRVFLAAADTFRAAAIEQLKVWGERVKAEVIAHQYGSDPGAVVYDALQAARSRGGDVLIVDTAGRLHTKYNLMEELKKIKRVLSKEDASAPHEILLVLDATTGQNGLNQARYFTEAVGITGIFLAKLDGTAKGGIVLAICDQLRIPIMFIGTGEKPDDLAPFDPKEFVEALLS